MNDISSFPLGLIERRTAFINQLRHALAEYYPTALEGFEDWGAMSAWMFLQRFPANAKSMLALSLVKMLLLLRISFRNTAKGSKNFSNLIPITTVRFPTWRRTQAMVPRSHAAGNGIAVGRNLRRV
jgi:hypothetical protein